MSAQLFAGAVTLRGTAPGAVVSAVAATLLLTLAPAAGAVVPSSARELADSARAASSTRAVSRRRHCHDGSLRAHSSFAGYLLCVKDGKVRRRPAGTITPPPPPPPPPVAPPPPPPPPVAPPPPPPPPTTLTAAVYGDSPYGTTSADSSQTLATPAFINAVNADPAVQLVLHVGDIHSGKQFCTLAYDQQIAGMWTQYSDPLVYTPGDNEWSDCHKIGEGGGAYNAATHKIDYSVDAANNPTDYAFGDPVANLDLVRRLFFAHAGASLGMHPMTVVTQEDAADPAYPTDREYRENVMWEQAGVLFVTVNIPGGSNNDTDPWYGAPTTTAAQDQEVAARTGADVRWINAAFAAATAHDVKAIVIQSQADMWDLDGKTALHLTQYDPFVNAVADGTASFGKPVLMFNGDSHVYKSDNPLASSDPLSGLHPSPPHNLANFHRVVVHGSTTPLEYLRLSIDTSKTNPTTDTSFGPFSWAHVLP